MSFYFHCFGSSGGSRAIAARNVSCWWSGRSLITLLWWKSALVVRWRQVYDKLRSFTKQYGVHEYNDVMELLE